MALETLKYGSFRPTWVQSDAKALPGYGGDVQSWADYKFAVSAVERKEAAISDGERKKLGPLALRLVERLAGPALQVAKRIGVDKLSGENGTSLLLQGLQKHLLPLQKQAALELYHAGMKDGILSRQHGEPMASYCLRRQSWWTQLQELDPEIKCSDGILGEQFLIHAGLGNLEQQMVRTGCQNDLSDLERLANTLRDQFGSVHERESRSKGGKGKGDGYRGWKSSAGWSSSYYAGEIADEAATEETYAGGEGTYEQWPDEEDVGYPDEDWREEAEDPREREIEEEVVAWYASQSIDAQVCSGDDLELVQDAVEVEMQAYYTKMQAESRGISAPASGNNYATTTMTSQERQAKVLAAKQRSRCRACGQIGHWARDPICPGRKGKGKVKGYGKKGGKGKFYGKKGDGKDFGGKSSGKKGGEKPRVVYFSLRDQEPEQPAQFMALSGYGAGADPGGREDETQENEAEITQAMESEVRRLMRLPPEQIDRMMQEELAFVHPTSKAAPPQMPESLTRGVYATMPPSASSSGGPGGCSHEKVTRRGTNAYINMITCTDCGKVLLKEPKETTRSDTTMVTMSPGECPHPEKKISWKGTNAHVWKWSCGQCGETQTHRKTPGAEKPVPGQRQGLTSVEDSGSRSVAGSQGSGTRVGRAETSVTADPQFLEEVMFTNPSDWQRFSTLLDRMMISHLVIYGQATHNDFYHIERHGTMLQDFGTGLRWTSSFAEVWIFGIATPVDGKCQWWRWDFW